MILTHDVTRIIPGRFKGPAFKKGHIIRPEDIPVLLSMGKENIFTLEFKNGFVHEDEAARRIAEAAAGPGLYLSAVSEGRVNLISEYPGLLKIDIDVLNQINSLGEIVFATRHSNHRVDAGLLVAGTRIIPLAAEEKLILAAERLCRKADPLIQIKPFKSFEVGLIVTGSEVYHGRIADAFGPVIVRKFQELGSRVLNQTLVSDNPETAVAAIHDMIGKGAHMVVLTGGMSVDPDDRTPAAIRASGAEIVTYGAPTFPGAMFMLAYLNHVPILGLPGCVMYSRTTIFDLIVPRILAGESITREEVTAMGHGGFCAVCPDCRYPLCGFGKG